MTLPFRAVASILPTGRQPVTIADTGCWHGMVSMTQGGMDITRWPNAHAWSGRLAQQPSSASPLALIPKTDTEFDPCA